MSRRDAHLVTDLLVVVDLLVLVNHQWCCSMLVVVGDVTSVPDGDWKKRKKGERKGGRKGEEEDMK